MKKTFLVLAIITVTAAFNSCRKADSPVYDKSFVSAVASQAKVNDAKVALDWYKLQLHISLNRNAALNGAYYGYIGIGLYESVRYLTPNSISLSTKLYQMPQMPAKENKTYNWQESANAALANMLRSFNKGLTTTELASIDSLEDAYNQRLLAAAGAEVFDRSQAFGQRIAAAIYTWSTTDNFNPSNAGYVPPVFPGSWVPTPPAYLNGIMPYVGAARTYLAADLTLVAPPPIPYSEDPNSDFYKMVKYLYDVSLTLTPAEKATALFWVDQGNGVGYTPDGHNIAVAVQAVDQAHANLAIAAEALAKACMADREATIICFRSKYTYNLLRPVTYIQKLIDPTWLPFIVTPPHPEYPAAHAFQTCAVMEAATKVLGDNSTVTDHSYDFRGWAPRTYTPLFAAGQEAGISRLYGGIHYLPSINEGYVLGKEIGDRIGEIKLH